ncbi:unnamed protein product [Cochlearia groenlandica]
MEENPHRVSRRNTSGTHYQNDAVEEDNRRQRHYNHHHHTYGEEIKCSGGKRCRGSSWAATAIADCVAICCCPCAIINFLTLTFVKVPWMIGRRCLGGGGRSNKNKKKKRRMLHKRQQQQRRGRINGEDDEEEEEKCCSGGGGGGRGCCGGGGGYDDHRFVVERDGSLTKEEEEEKTTAFSESRISARVEAERVWLELYQIGHLGFGRVSFTGIQ